MSAAVVLADRAATSSPRCPPTLLLHLTRMPPSPSGVAAYAAVFREALAQVAPVRTLRLPPSPSSSQSVPLALRLTEALLRRTRDPGTVLVVEQAGRGLAEFWAAWWLARRGRRIWLTVHDVPELSGGAFFTRSLDRRGGRRIAARLSAGPGRRAERDLLQRAERVFCLAPSGAGALVTAHHLTRPVTALPHVAALPPLDAIPPADRREILIPGYIAAAEDVLPLIRAADQLPEGWRLTVGACPPPVADRLERLVRELRVTDRVRLLGFTDEAGVRAAFGRAAVVIRWRRNGWTGGACHAVGGPLIAAFAHGCAVITNDDRGAGYLLTEARAVVVGSGDSGERALLAALATLIGDDADRRSRAADARDLAERRHSPAAVAAVLRRAD